MAERGTRLQALADRRRTERRWVAVVVVLLLVAALVGGWLVNRSSGPPDLVITTLAAGGCAGVACVDSAMAWTCAPSPSSSRVDTLAPC
jgi:hypothetical protein